MSGSPPVRQSLITDPQGVSEIEQEWRALAEARGNAFVTPEWFRAWWEHIGQDGASPLVASLTENGALVGVMPLVLDTSRRPHTIRFAGAALGDRFHPVAAEADEGRVATATMSLLHTAELDRRLIRLERVDPERSWPRALTDACPRRMIITHQQRTEQPYIRLGDVDWEGYLATRSSSFRKKLRQRERKLGEGRDVVVRCASAETLQADLGTYFDLHERRWQERSSILSPAARNFLTTFATAAESRGWLRLRLLEVDGAAVAAFLGWRVGDRYAFYNSGFDPEWGDLSVGIVLLTRTIQSAIEEGATEFDMLLGDEEYKRRFTELSRTGETVLLAPRMSPVSLLATGEGRARNVGRRLLPMRGVGRVAERLRRGLPGTRM